MLNKITNKKILYKALGTSENNIFEIRKRTKKNKNLSIFHERICN